MSNKINMSIDERNIRLFKDRYQMTLDDKRCYICTICHKKVDLSESMSERGHKLICNRCYYNKIYDKYPGRSYWHNDER